MNQKSTLKLNLGKPNQIHHLTSVGAVEAESEVVSVAEAEQAVVLSDTQPARRGPIFHRPNTPDLGTHRRPPQNSPA